MQEVVIFLNFRKVKYPDPISTLVEIKNVRSALALIQNFYRKLAFQKGLQSSRYPKHVNL